MSIDALILLYSEYKNTSYLPWMKTYILIFFKKY